MAEAVTHAALAQVPDVSAALSGPVADPAVRRHIGGSDVGAIVGVDKYRTPRDVYERIVGTALERADTGHTKRGRRLEMVAVEVYEEETGSYTQPFTRTLVDPEYDFLRGHPDRRITNAADAMAPEPVLEVKCPSLGSFLKIQREGLPQSYAAQLQWYLMFTTAPYGEFAVFCADQWKLVTFRVECDEPLQELLRERAVAFWKHHVVPRVPPPAAGEAEREEQAAVEIARVGGKVAVVTRTDAEFGEALQLLREARLLAKNAELIEEQARARVLELIGEQFGVYEAPGAGRLYFTQTKGRASFDRKALEAARPLDPAKVREVLAADMGLERAEQFVGICRRLAAVDFSTFEKVGKPGTQFRPYFFGGER